jgi:hypothetical protein
MTNRHDARSRSRRAFFFVTTFGPFSLPAFSETLGKITGRIEVQVQQTAPPDLALQIGLFTESVEVPASAGVLQDENSALGAVIEATLAPPPDRRLRATAPPIRTRTTTLTVRAFTPLSSGREASRIRNDSVPCALGTIHPNNSPFNSSPPACMHSVEASRSQWTGRSSWRDENQSTTGLGGAGHTSARHPRGEFRRFSGLNATAGISTRAAMGW